MKEEVKEEGHTGDELSTSRFEDARKQINALDLARQASLLDHYK